MSRSELRAKLDPQIAMFCDNYVQRDITQLAIGDIAANIWPDVNNPAQKAARILKRADVQKYLESLQTDFLAAVDMGLTEIRMRLAQEIRGIHDRFPYLEWLPVTDDKKRTTFKPHVRRVEDIPHEDRRYVALIEPSDTGYFAVTLIDDLQAKDRNKAFEMLIRMNGGFNDNVNLNANLRHVTPDDIENAPDAKAAGEMYQQFVKS